MLVVRGDADGSRDPAEQHHLQAPGQAERPLVPKLDQIVEEADPAAGHRRPEDRERRQRARARGEERDRRGEHDQHSSHRRRPLFGGMVLRALLADHLTEGVAAQEVDEGRACEERDDQRDERCDENACHLVA